MIRNEVSGCGPRQASARCSAVDHGVAEAGEGGDFAGVVGVGVAILPRMATYILKPNCANWRPVSAKPKVDVQFERIGIKFPIDSTGSSSSFSRRGSAGPPARTSSSTPSGRNWTCSRIRRRGCGEEEELTRAGRGLRLRVQVGERLRRAPPDWVHDFNIVTHDGRPVVGIHQFTAIERHEAPLRGKSEERFDL